MPQPVVQVDAFTNRPFAGNPAAVCILPAARDEGWMQDVAAEMNLSETAFLVAREDGWELRWFTPEVEVDLCGHATLASAHVLWADGHLAAEREARFHTRSGLLTATRADDGWITLDFPAKPAREGKASPALARALGTEPKAVAWSHFDALAVLESEAQVRALAPDLGLLREVEVRGVIVTAPSDTEGVDFVSRFFAPRAGVNEDPVTGSAHCVLAPYWCGVLGRDSLTGFQASRRGGTVRVELKGDRVLLGGQAVTTMRGELL